MQNVKLKDFSKNIPLKNVLSRKQDFFLTLTTDSAPYKVKDSDLF